MRSSRNRSQHGWLALTADFCRGHLINVYSRVVGVSPLPWRVSVKRDFLKNTLVTPHDDSAVSLTEIWPRGRDPHSPGSLFATPGSPDCQSCCKHLENRHDWWEGSKAVLSPQIASHFAEGGCILFADKLLLAETSRILSTLQALPTWDTVFSFQVSLLFDRREAPWEIGTAISWGGRKEEMDDGPEGRHGWNWKRDSVTEYQSVTGCTTA